MWIAKLIRNSLVRDLDSGLSKLRGKTLGTMHGKAPSLGHSHVRILRGRQITDTDREALPTTDKAD